MCSTASSPGGIAGAAACRPPQADAQSARPRTAAALDARQFSVQPFMELPDDMLLRHDYSALMWPRAQPLLIEFAHLRIFGHDAVGEFHDIAQVKLRIGERLR